MKKNKKNKKDFSFKPNTHDCSYLTYVKHLSLKILGKDSYALIYLDMVDMDTLSKHVIKTHYQDYLSLFIQPNNPLPLHGLTLSDFHLNQEGFVFYIHHNHQEYVFKAYNIEHINSFMRTYNLNMVDGVNFPLKELISNYEQKLVLFDGIYFQLDLNNNPFVTLTFIEPYDNLREETKRRIYTLSFNAKNLTIENFKS